MPEHRVVATANPLFRVDLDAARVGLDGSAWLDTYELPRERVTGADEDAVVAALVNADGLLVRVGTLSQNILERLPKLRVVALHGVGVDQVDVEAATGLGIWVSNVPGGNSQAVVEFTLGMMIAMLRRLPAGDAGLRSGVGWDASRYLGYELGGKTVGLVGYGNIGKQVAAVLQALGATLIATRRGEAQGRDGGVTFVPLEMLLQTSDIVSLHLPLTGETRSLVDERAISMMKPGSYLVNMARGPIVDQHALVAALKSGHLAGAALDVFETEPPDFQSPLFLMPNVVLAPHMAGSTHEALATIARRAASDIRRVLSGLPPEHPVNRPEQHRGGSG
jgi:D-3-phosphoglycerate dehydrogenase / 2-oxoglutarate reductase